MLSEAVCLSGRDREARSTGPMWGSDLLWRFRHVISLWGPYSLICEIKCSCAMILCTTVWQALKAWQLKGQRLEGLITYFSYSQHVLCVPLCPYENAGCTHTTPGSVMINIQVLINTEVKLHLEQIFPYKSVSILNLKSDKLWIIHIKVIYWFFAIIRCLVSCRNKIIFP